MINYRLNDSMPVDLRHEWESFLTIEDELERRKRIETYLDRGLGNCELRSPQAAAAVEENWLRGDGKNYRLLAWVVMPNHVHVLVEIWQLPQSQLIRNWKGYSSRKVNTLLSRAGKLWQDDYWDRYIRDEAHFQKVVHYIETNPVQAGLVKEPALWPFSSARFRDSYNRLQTPVQG